MKVSTSLDETSKQTNQLTWRQFSGFNIELEQAKKRKKKMKEWKWIQRTLSDKYQVDQHSHCMIPRRIERDAENFSNPGKEKDIPYKMNSETL